jgi:DNA-binding LacI/PurR family transcriptional regulator
MKTPKHRSIFESLQQQIRAGKFGNGRRMPSEQELARRFKVSRPTAARAVRDLQNLGLVSRRVGSGTYVSDASATRATASHHIFGLLVPGLGDTEIVDPICNEITRFAQANGHTVLWGDSPALVTSVAEVESLCRQYIERKVAGVFFAPFQAVPDREAVNLHIVNTLRNAGIGVVLLDREVIEFPRRSNLDLIGIDNFQAGLILAEHLLSLGHRRLGFLARPDHPSTTDLRLAGCREAVARHNLASSSARVFSGEPTDRRFVKQVLNSPRPDAVVCANDLAAALLIQTLTSALRLSVPRDMAVVGFDDVNYSTLLASPLTTMRQPCRAIAQTAVNTLIERLGDPAMAPRQILLDAELVIRKSCGAGHPGN